MNCLAFPNVERVEDDAKNASDSRQVSQQRPANQGDHSSLSHNRVRGTAHIIYIVIYLVNPKGGKLVLESRLPVLEKRLHGIRWQGKLDYDLAHVAVANIEAGYRAPGSDGRERCVYGVE